MSKNLLSPIGVPCRFEGSRIVAESKFQDVVVSRMAGVKVWAVFSQQLSSAQEEILLLKNAAEIEWDNASDGCIAPYLLQCVGFSESLTAIQRDEFESILNSYSRDPRGNEVLTLHKWDGDSCSVLMRASIGSDAIRLFKDFLDEICQSFSVRSWQGNTVNENP